MKVVLAGAWRYEMYEAAFARALAQLGVDVRRVDLTFEPRGLIAKVEEKYSLQGRKWRQVQANLLSVCRQFKPEIVLIWKGASIVRDTLVQIKKDVNTLIIGYIHDDPFAFRVHRISPSHHWLYWRPFIKALPEYDLVLFAKQLAVDDALALGAKKAGVLRQYFVPWIHRPMPLSGEEEVKYRCDVAFAGHYEPDGRDNAILALSVAGLKVNLYQGGLWAKSPRLLSMNSNWNLTCASAVLDDDYAKALGSAAMGLCFMSKMNRDPYTTRCFEIPACGTVLLSERTPELLRLFREDEEAIFFSSVDELLQKAVWLKENPDMAENIAAAGRRRVYSDGHSVNDRALELLDMVGRLRE